MVLILAGITAILYFTGVLAPVQAPPIILPPQEEPIECQSDTTPTVTFTGYTKNRPGITATADFAYRKQGDIAWTGGILGTAITTWSVGDVISVVMGNASNSVDTLGAYYSYPTTYTVPCEEAPTKDFELAAESTAASVSTAWKNNNDQVSTAMAIGTGETKTGWIKVSGQIYTDFGSKHCSDLSNTITCFRNTTEVNSIKLGSPQYKTVATPQYIVQSTNPENQSISFEFPVVESSGESGWIQMAVEAKSGQDPGVSISKGVYCIITDSNYAQDVNTGEYSCSREDESGGDVGIASTTAPVVHLLYS